MTEVSRAACSSDDISICRTAKQRSSEFCESCQEYTPGAPDITSSPAVTDFWHARQISVAGSSVPRYLVLRNLAPKSCRTKP
jgi:hypothetical protein